jgi:cytochrome c biogenesis protein
VDGAKVFLVGHGYAPHIVVRDRTGAVVFDDEVPFLPQDGNFTSTWVVKAPDGTPQLGLQGFFLPTAAVDQVRGPHSVFPAPDNPAVFLSAWQGDLGLDWRHPAERVFPGHRWDGPDRPAGPAARARPGYCPREPGR